MEKRILSTELESEDRNMESGLRPKYLQEYIGQEKVKNNLKVFIDAAKMRGEALDHILLYGPPGLGKTTLSGIIANEMGSHLKITSGPAIEKPGELAAILNGLSERDVLFIDEIHRLNRQVEEVLYPAMEDYAIDVMIGKGPMAKSVRLELPKFTLVGATTRAGMSSADKLDVSIDLAGARLLAMRSRGTPRLVNRLLRRVRDFAMVRFDGMITADVVDTALELLDVDDMGLDSTDQAMLSAIIKRFNGGPVGLDTLAASIGEDSATIEDVYEPFLLQRGLLIRTPKGRIVTKQAYEHLGLMDLYQED